VVAGRNAWPIPEGLSLQQAAAIPITFGTADDCLFEFGRLKPGETVLVQAGASGVGVAAIQLASASEPPSWPPPQVTRSSPGWGLSVSIAALTTQQRTSLRR
jgi:hypothetical protein